MGSYQTEIDTTLKLSRMLSKAEGAKLDWQTRDGAMLSVVIPCYNEAETLASSWRQLAEASLRWEEPCEFIFVDDGSTDGTWEQIKKMAAEDTRVLGVRLCENLGQQQAIRIGLAHAQGEAVVVMDADLQDPVELVPILLEQWRAGADMAIAVRRSRPYESWWKRLGSALVYGWLWRLGTGRTLPDAGDYALLDRQVVRWLLRWRTWRPFWRGLRELGPFRRAYVEYDRKPRSVGRSHYSLSRLCGLAWDGLFGLTNWPRYLLAGSVAAGILVSSMALLALWLGALASLSASLIILVISWLAVSVQWAICAETLSRLVRLQELPPAAYVVEYAGQRQTLIHNSLRRPKVMFRKKARNT